MVNPKRRFIDAHMHLWDTASFDWYRFPVPGDNSGLGLKEPFPARFLLDEYLESMAAAELIGCVHVSAVTAPKDADAETDWIASMSEETGLPSVFIGTVDIADPLSEIQARIEAACNHRNYRGIRLLAKLDYASALADTLIGFLDERGLIYDVVAHPGEMSAAATALKRHPGAIAVLEHTGWPLSIDADGFRYWKQEMMAFAELPNAYCKLSGLGMAIHSTDNSLFHQYFDACIDAFGPDRCMFASNFPVDLSYGSAESLFAVFEDVAGRYTNDEADLLFRGTAKKIYRT